MSDGLPSKRSLQKQVRRSAIVAAAEGLVRRSESVAFSMLELADAAGVSPATPYNLFGSKSAILYALLNGSADRIFAAAHAPRGNAVDRALAAAAALADVLSADPGFYRPLYAYLLGVEDATWRPPFMTRAHEYWVAPFATSSGLTMVLDAAVLGDLLVTQALGCVEMWVHREIDDHGLATELRRSCSAILLGIASDDARAALAENVSAPRSVRTADPAAGAIVHAAAAPSKKRRASA